jgi:hypothetical protein
MAKTKINQDEKRKAATDKAAELREALTKAEILLKELLEDKFIASRGVSGKCNFVAIPNKSKNKLTIKFNVEVTGPLDTF